MAQTNITVLGAGVTGLTTAMLLSRDKRYNVTIVAKHMPGDDSIEYCSTRGGANYMPFAGPGTPSQHYESNTWAELARLAKDVPEAGIHFQTCLVYRRQKDVGTDAGNLVAELIREDAWFRHIVPDFRVLTKDELPTGVDGGTSFGSVCINPDIYLPYLASLCLKNGAAIRRGDIKHISQAADYHHSGQRADMVVNCTGLGSLKLGGVEDKAMYPMRGQLVLVRNTATSMAATSGTDDDGDEGCYIMNRAAGGGCVLGGSFQKGDWKADCDEALSKRIMQRCLNLCPDLVPKGKGVEALSVIRQWAGLRPMRETGIRVETSMIERSDGKSIPVVHNYGHGGYGFQTSYGCANKAIALVDDALQHRARL